MFLKLRKTMQFPFTVSSIQSKLLLYTYIITAMILAPPAASRSRPTKKPTTTTRWRDNPLYVQNFVSMMMSYYPIQNEPKVPGMWGVSKDPNLGYEPYWINVPDRSWKDKCDRCTPLFKRYHTVCAVDSTGDLMIEASLCKILQMNCLNGHAEGESSGYYQKYKNDYLVVADGWTRFSVKQKDNSGISRNLVIQLSSTPDTNFPRYEIIIDEKWWWWAKFRYTAYSSIAKNDYGKWWYQGQVLYADRYTEFVAHWNRTSGWFLITATYLRWSGYTNGFHFNFTDWYPFPIRYIAIGGYGGYSGNWIVEDLPKGFVITRFGPCQSDVQRLVKPVPTSPTDIPGIMGRISPANIDFFSRVNYAGVQKGNVSFSTREEY